MAAKKKPTTTAPKPAPTAPAEAKQPENGIQEEAAKTILNPEASTAEKLEAQQSIAEKLQEQENHEQEQPHEPEQAPEPEQTTEPISEDTPCPFEATVSVALAVLRKASGLGTAEMLKPVATLKQGTKVTVVAMKDGGCLLRNGLWTASEYLTK